MAKRRKKGLSRKTVKSVVWRGNGWNVVKGELVRSPGRPYKVDHLFRCVAEKIPFESLSNVRKAVIAAGIGTEGVYLAHDSMGVARYGGRGRIFPRLASRKRAYPRELAYFSFYIIKEKQHEREIETAIIRAAGSQLILNTRKKRDGIDPGSVRDYEPGTKFIERQKRKGKGANNHAPGSA